MAKTTINFRKIFIEALSIAFAVFLALLARQWGENRNHQKLADKALVNISEELIENKDVMLDLIPYHQKKIRELDSIIVIIKNDSTYQDTLEQLKITLISSTAWEMAKITNAIYYMDFEEVNNLAKVYNLQSYYESIVKQYILKSSSEYQDDNSIETLKSKRLFLKSTLPLEESLKSYYNMMLDDIESSHSN